MDSVDRGLFRLSEMPLQTRLFTFSDSDQASALRGMSWIKPNFLWMMFRCGWATKVNQERVLAIHLRRPFFESLLAEAIPSTHSPTGGTHPRSGTVQCRHLMCAFSGTLTTAPPEIPPPAVPSSSASGARPVDLSRALRFSPSKTSPTLSSHSALTRLLLTSSFILRQRESFSRTIGPLLRTRVSKDWEEAG